MTGEKRLCSMDGCDRPHTARGLCHKHYRAFLKAGGERKSVMDRRYGMTPEARFWSYVQKGPRCWEWTGYKNEKGYGVINLGGPRMLAHRYAYQLRSIIPDDLFVLHHCDNPACVKFKHLFLGTLADNNADMDEKGRARRTGLVMMGKGEANPSAKLTEAMVREIRASKESSRILGPRYGVAFSQIVAIRARRTWSHITDA